MPFDFKAGMEEATRLTRDGKLAEATALIQRLFQSSGSPEPAAKASPATIDADYVVLDGPASRPGAKPKAKPDADRAGAFGAGLHARPRHGLAETLRQLKAKVKPGFGGGIAGARPAADPLPDGAAFLTASYSSQAGTRAYKLYVPANLPEGRRPLVVMLHGCTQSPDDFAAGTRMNSLAEEFGVLVAYPAQPTSANANRCWNWFNPEDQRRDRGEPSLLAGITRQIMRDHDVDPARVYIAGLSAGGAAAAIMAAAYPDLYAAVGIHSGLPVGAARDIPSAFTAMRQGSAADRLGDRAIPAIIFHGDQDTTVNPRNGDAVAGQFAGPASGSRLTSQRGQASGGHAYSRTVRSDDKGRTLGEVWTIHGAGHAWAGGSAAGSYTDPRGPDASREMMRFFLDQQNRVADPV